MALLPIPDSPAVYEERSYFSGDAWADSCFRLASFLTDPVCKVDELYARLFVEDSGYAGARAAFLGAQMVGYGALGAVGGPLGLGLRALGCYLQKNPFRFIETGAKPKKLEGNRFSLLSWNICCVGGGYPITDGGVPSWPSRIDAIARAIIEKNADVVCLYETFDYGSVLTLTERTILAEKLKEQGYTHIYCNIGPRALGVCSGISVFSKFETAEPEFVPFPESTLVGRTKNATKGVFSFSLKDGERTFARIYATHLQHSEKPAHPEKKERVARAAQMKIITDKMNAEKQHGVCSILTGDLNLDDEEYNMSSWKDLFNKGKLLFDPVLERTWGGDAYCAKLSNCRSVASSVMAFFTNLIWEIPIVDTLGSKEASGPLNLDHTAILKGTIGTLKTSLLKTHFNHEVYREFDEEDRPILSDHQGLYSEITLSSMANL